MLDEAQSLEPEIWEGLFALATGAENKIVAIGNPGAPAGKWHEINQSEVQTACWTARECLSDNIYLLDTKDLHPRQVHKLLYVCLCCLALRRCQ